VYRNVSRVRPHLSRASVDWINVARVSASCPAFSRFTPNSFSCTNQIFRNQTKLSGAVRKGCNLPQ
jgi:hypothetical protein